MLDIEQINRLEEDAMKLRLEEEGRRQRQDNQNKDNTRRIRMNEMVEGQRKAEEKFPSKMAELEIQIRYAIKEKRRLVEFSCYIGDDWATQYLQIMFVQVLPLQGMTCKIHESYIHVGW